MVQVLNSTFRTICAQLIGIPYKNFGRDITGGFDCYGLCIELYNRLGIQLPDPVRNYKKNWSKFENHITENEKGSFSILESGVIGDLIVCQIHAPVPNHLMILLDDTFAINCSENAGVHTIRRSILNRFLVHYLHHRELNIITQ